MSTSTISSITNGLTSWVGSGEKQLALGIIGTSCNGLSLLGKTWRGLPPIVMRTAEVYLSFSSLLYLDYSFRILGDRIHLVKKSYKLGNYKITFYAGLETTNCALSIFTTIGYALISVTPKKDHGRIYEFLKPFSRASLVIGTICNLWTRWIVTNSAYIVKNNLSTPVNHIALIRAWLSPVSPNPITATVIAALHMEVRQAIHEASEHTFQLIKENLITRSSQVNSSLLQTLTYFGHQYISKNHPGTSTLAGVNFALSLFFLATKIRLYLQTRQQRNGILYNNSPS